MARAEISRFLGGEGAVDGFEVEIDNIPANDLLNRMENTGDSQAKIRWRKVAAPLHLAEQVEEYIWDWELTGRR